MKEIQKEINDVKRIISNAINSYNMLVDTLTYINTCKICNKEYYNNNLSKYCSKLCAGKARRNMRVNVKDVKRLTKNGPADYSINLDRLIERDGDCCHICGGHTDRNDKWLHTDGKTIICGNNYPSIDHVIPIAKGGLHRWDNVKVAHRLCNSKKRDKLK